MADKNCINYDPECQACVEGDCEECPLKKETEKQIENGYYTSEWNTYVNNGICIIIVFCIISYILGTTASKMS